MKLLKALYGLKQSAKLWFNLIDEVLKAMGFVPNLMDPCCYNRMVFNNQATVCLHVDDMLITHQTDEGCLCVQNLIKQQFDNKQLSQIGECKRFGYCTFIEIGKLCWSYECKRPEECT